MQPDGGLQIRPLQGLAKQAAKLAVHANVDIGLNQPRHIGQVTAQREHHVHFRTDALHQSPDFGQVTGRVEGAITGPDDVDAGLFSWRSGFDIASRRHLAQPILGPQPRHGSVGALPLVFINRAWQEALQGGAFRRHASTNHFGDAAGHHHSRKLRVQHGVGSLHGTLGAFAPKLLFAQTCHHNGQLMGRERIGIVQDARDRQVLTADRTVHHDLQALDRGKDIHRAPVPAGTVVIQDQR